MEEKKTTKGAKNSKAEDAAVVSAERKAKIDEKIVQLVELAKKKKNMLEYQEITEFSTLATSSHRYKTIFVFSFFTFFRKLSERFLPTRIKRTS